MNSISTSCEPAALGRLEAWFAACPQAAVALSGGVDSSLVAYLTRQSLGFDLVTAFLADSPSLKRKDMRVAEEFCARNDIRLIELETDELGSPDYAANPSNRCYFCKSTLYSKMSELLPEDGSIWILNGTNADDLGDYRPGLAAATEQQVHSPLAECGVDKSTVRALAEGFSLACWNKPASPCLSSRVPYGQPVTREKLGQIEAGEAILESLGFDVARVRHFEDRAVIEVEAHRLGLLEAELPKIEEDFQRIGFDRVEIDREGFVTGKLNRVLGR